MQDTEKHKLDPLRTENSEKSYANYPDYKHVKYEKFNEIPLEWEIYKLGQVSNIYPSNVDKKEKEGEIKVGLCNYTDVYNNSEITSNLDFMTATAKKSEIDKFQLKEGDIIITKDSESWDDIGVPAYVAENMGKVICGYHLAYIDPHRLHGKYLYYFIQSDAGSHHFHVEANGVTRYGITMKGIKTAPVLAPPKYDQEQIIKFLDSELEKIESLISKKKLLLDLLLEKEQTLITKLVSGKQSDSELTEVKEDWIEEKPVDWKGLKLKRWLEQKIKDGPHETPEYVEEGIPFLSANSVRDGKIDFDRRQGDISEELYKEYKKKVSPKKDDIFLIKSGATTGKMAMVKTEKDFCIWSPIAVIRANKDIIEPKFLYYALKSDYAQAQVEKSWSDGTQENLGMRDLERISIIAPDIYEQKEIIKQIEKESQNIEKLSKKIQQGINQLKEYRTTLITEAVTGQIDVRGEI